MEEKGIISESVSQYASPLVMVRQKDSRWLKAKTIKDAYPLPLQDDCLADLGINALFRTLDLTSGFYNIPIHVSDRRYTTFTTPMGSLLCYLDDLLVFATSKEEEFKCLEIMFSQLINSNLKLAPTKCHFLGTLFILYVFYLPALTTLCEN